MFMVARTFLYWVVSKLSPYSRLRQYLYDHYLSHALIHFQHVTLNKLSGVRLINKYSTKLSNTVDKSGTSDNHVLRQGLLLDTSATLTLTGKFVFFFNPFRFCAPMCQA